VNFKKSLVPLLFATATLGAVPAAQAGFITTDIYDPTGTTLLGSDVFTIDYNATGVAVAVGAGPFGTPLTVNQTFTLNLMTNVVGFSQEGGGSAVTAAGATNLFVIGAPFEITAVASFTEVVTSVSASGATFAVVPNSGTVSLYWSAANADYATGVGFDDGTLIYQATILFGSSSFEVTGTDTGTGSVNVTGNATTIDTNVFKDLIGALAFSFVNPQGEASYPPPTTFPTQFFVGGSALYPTYTVVANDLPLRFDGSSRFLQEVPEPGTLALVGLTLTGLAWTRRKRQAEKI
jgi:hypothetical protein